MRWWAGGQRRMYRMTWCRTARYRALTSASECAVYATTRRERRQAQLTNIAVYKHSLQILYYTSTCDFFFESPASRRAFFPFSELLGKRRDEKSIMRRFDSCLILSEAYMNMLCFPRTVSKLTSQLPHALGAGSEVGVPVS